MKKIIETALEQIGEKCSNNNEMLKLRLRGKGSGYKEGPDQLESEESLHLCISAKDERIYTFACESVEKLLQNVYQEYQEYSRKQGNQINVQLKKIDMSPPQQTSTQSNEGSLKSIGNNMGRL